MSKRTLVLLILDGWGIGRNDETNPIFEVQPKNINYLKANYPYAALQASGIAVGLPWGEEGNSEVGHLNIGAGKVLYQNYPRIALAIRDKSFFKNQAIKNAFEHSKKNNSAVNLIGLLTSANVHASLEHLLNLIKFAEQENVSKINLHLITDGRDSPPQSAIEILKKINFSEKIQLASVGGRYYGMDRDKHWDRVEIHYKTFLGEGETTDNIENHIKSAYAKDLNDQYIFPVSIGHEKQFIKDGDSIIFFNFREDRMRQIMDAFTNENFDKFPVKKFSNLYIATMVSYDEKFKTPVAFPKETVANPLCKILSDSGKIQFKIAETEKYAHITYFFNGQKEQPFPNEYRMLIPSRSEVRHDNHPEMMAIEIASRIIEAIEEGSYDFILANIANPDMIAHTGNYEATIKAIEVVDEQIGKIMKVIFERNGILMITSDHGNAERMFNPMTGEPETQHDLSPIPIHLAAKEYYKPKNITEINQAEKTTIGILADVAPTILELMRIPQPKEMTGQSLLKFLI